MKSQFWPIILNLVASLIGALGQWLYKRGAQLLGEVPLYKNIPFLSGVACFCVVMVLFMAAFKLGGRISVTFPVYALTFVWGTMIGVLMDKEPFNQGQALGVAFVCLGVALVGGLASR